MQIRKIDNNQSPKFKRLYMPARKTLSKYGADFTKVAESQRNVLKDYAKDFDIYLIPRYKNEDLNFFQEIWKASKRSVDEFWKYMPKGNYFNIHVAPKFPRIYRDLDKRNSFDEIYSAFGVESLNLVESLERVLSQKRAVKILNEKTQYYKTFS